MTPTKTPPTFARRRGWAPPAAALVLACCPLAAVLAAPPTPQTDLILRAAPPGIAAEAAPGVAEAVRIDAPLLAAAPETLWIETVAGEGRWAYRNQVERGSGGDVVWRGRFAEDDPAYTSVTLSLHDGVVHGRVELPAGPTWLLRPHGGGGSLLTVEDGSGVVCGVGRGRRPEAAAAPSGTPPEAAGAVVAATEEREIFVLILYTPSAAARLGALYIEQLAPHHVDLLNTTFANSGVDGRASLAGVAQVELGMNGLGGQEAVDHAYSQPAAQELQNRYRADVVSVVADGTHEVQSWVCGWANLMFRHLHGPQMANQAYNVISHRCYGLSWLFAHEVAHNFGAHHDPASAGAADQTIYPFNFAHGVDGHFRTLMSYDTACDDCVLLETVLSNPLRSIDGIPTGIADERDNALTLNLTFPLVASFRSGRPPAPGPAAPGGLAAAAVSPTAVALTWSDHAADETGYQVEALAEAVPAAGWQRRAELPADTTAHTVDGLEADAAYHFRVRAVRHGVASAFSNEASARTPPALPATPLALVAEPLSADAVTLRWDPAQRATGYEVELRTADPAADRAAAPIAFAGGDDAGLTGVVDGLQAATPHSFRVRAVGAFGASPWSAEASASTDRDDAAGPCGADASTLCLLDDRFAVSAAWRNQRPPFNHGAATAQAAPGSRRTGLFTFFNPDNVELAVKMLDGRPVNGAFWHFFGALSDVEYWITVRDTADATSRTYHNPPFELCGRGDTAAFPGVPDEPEPAAPLLAFPAPAEAAACAVGSPTLCLAGGRFEVEVEWTNPRREGDAGVGRVFDASGGGLSGHFWFFRPDNLELSVKILDGRAVNGHFWIFWGGLSDVGYTLRVTDTESGEVHRFTNPPFTLCGGAATDVL